MTLIILGTNEKYVNLNLIKVCYEKTLCRDLRLLQSILDSFEVKCSLKQKNALSAVLFNLALEKTQMTKR